MSSCLLSLPRDVLLEVVGKKVIERDREECENSTLNLALSCKEFAAELVSIPKNMAHTLVERYGLSRALNLAAHHGKRAIVEALCVEFGSACDNCSSCLTTAASNGHLDIVVLLTRRFGFKNARAVAYAAQNDHLDIVRMLTSSFPAECNNIALALALAAKAGRLTVVEFLYESYADGLGFDALMTAMSYATVSFQDSVIQFLYPRVKSRASTVRERDMLDVLMDVASTDYET